MLSRTVRLHSDRSKLGFSDVRHSAPMIAPQQVPLGPGLWTARAMEGPTRPQSCRRASLESRQVQPIRRSHIVTIDRAIRVTFVDEAIRWVKFASRLTVPADSAFL